MAATDFFRPEVVLHRQRGAVGSIRLVRPLSLTVLTLVVATLAIGVAVWLATASYTRKVRLDGWISSDPADGLRTELFATASTVRAIRTDQSVRLRYPALGVAPLSATAVVAAVSRSSIAASDLPGLPAWIASRAANEPIYRITARLDLGPSTRDGRPPVGAVVDADVRIERRRLVEWLFRAPARTAAPA